MFRISCCLFACLILLPRLFAQPVPAYPPPSLRESALVGEVFSSDASVRGSVVLAGHGMRLLSGSTVTAGTQPASVRLARGGELRVCPDTGITVSSSPAREFMLGLNSGAFEAHYPLGTSSDLIVTPDFRMVLAGPGDFHIAIGADFKGDACVKSLDGNTGSVSVTELMGSGSYQMKPGEQVYFRNGSVAESVSQPLMECGCPGQLSLERAVQKAANEKPALPRMGTVEPPPPDAASLPVNMPAVNVPVEQPAMEAISAESLPLSQPGDVHVQVEVPFVFRAKEPDPAPEPDVIALSRPLETPSIFETLLTNNPPPIVEKPKKRGFFSRVGGFFAALFR